MSFRSVAERMKKRCSVPLVGCPIFKGQFSCRESQILRLNWLSSCWITLGLNWLWLGRSGDLGTEHLLMPCWGLVENEHVCCEVGSCSVLCQDRNIYVKIWSSNCCLCVTRVTCRMLRGKRCGRLCENWLTSWKPKLLRRWSGCSPGLSMMHCKHPDTLLCQWDLISFDWRGLGEN